MEVASVTKPWCTIMAIWIVKFPLEGYSIRDFWPKQTNKQIIVFWQQQLICKLPKFYALSQISFSLFFNKVVRQLSQESGMGDYESEVDENELDLDGKPEVSNEKLENLVKRQRYTYRVLQTIQIKLILLCVWAEPAFLGSTRIALKLEYEI